MTERLPWNALVRALARTTLFVAMTLAFLSAGFLVATAPQLVGLLLIAVLIVPLAASPTFTLIAFLVLTVFSNYLSSWLPATGAFPSGAVMRDAFGIVFLLSALFFLVARGDRGEDSPRRGLLSGGERRAFVGLSLAFLVWLGASIAISEDTFVAIYASRNLLLYAAIGIAAFALMERGHISADIVGWAVLLVGFVASALGVVDALTAGRSTRFLGYDSSYANIDNLGVVGEGALGFLGIDRASGGITDAVSFGYLTTLIALYAAYRFLFGTSTRLAVTRFEVIVCATSALACALSLTRGAMLTLVIGLVLMLVFSPRKRRAVVVVSALCLTAAYLATGSYKEVLVTRIYSSDPLSQRSALVRLDQADYGIDTLREKPFGTGLGSEGFAQARYAAEAGGQAKDNYLLIVALQIGLPGALVMLGALGVLLAAAWRLARRGRGFALCLLTGFLLAALLSHAPDNSVYATPLWLLVALSFLSPSTATEPAPERRAVSQVPAFDRSGLAA